MPIDLFVIFRS